MSIPLPNSGRPPIVFGKVALNPGKTTSFSQGGPLVTVWAPGKDVTCAAHDQNGNRLDTGISPASAMTAGLVAYFLSLRQSLPFPVGGGTPQATLAIILITWRGGPDLVEMTLPSKGNQ